MDTGIRDVDPENQRVSVRRASSLVPRAEQTIAILKKVQHSGPLWAALHKSSRAGSVEVNESDLGAVIGFKLKGQMPTVSCPGQGRAWLARRKMGDGSC